MDLYACGVKPDTVSTIAELHPLLRRDGAAILDGAECGEQATRALAQEIFAEHTLAVPEAARVFEGGEYDHARSEVTQSMHACGDFTKTACQGHRTIVGIARPYI